MLPWSALPWDLVRKQFTFADDHWHNLMCTSRELRLLTSSVICKIHVGDLEALATFPRHAQIRAISVGLPYDQKDIQSDGIGPEVPRQWLSTMAAAGADRLAHVRAVRLHVDVKDGRYAAFHGLLETMAEVLPHLESLKLCVDSDMMGLEDNDDGSEADERFWADVGRLFPTLHELVSGMREVCRGSTIKCKRLHVIEYNLHCM